MSVGETIWEICNGIGAVVLGIIILAMLTQAWCG